MDMEKPSAPEREPKRTPSAAAEPALPQDPDANIHQEHRKRLRDRFLQSGLESFTEEQTLELVLFYAIPRRDVRKIARALLRRFHTLSGVLEAGADELREVEGVGEQSASLLALILPLCRRYEASRAERLSGGSTRDAALAQASALLIGRREETLAVVCTDSKYRVLAQECMERGTAHALTVETRRIVELAVRSGASSVTLVHSHPNGELAASEADRRFGNRLETVLQELGICLADNLIWRDGEFVRVE